MTYQSFLDEIQPLVNITLPEGMMTEYRSVRKNNDVNFTGICILRESEKYQATPIIYMESFYEEYENGASLEALSRRISEELLVPVPEFLGDQNILSKDFILENVTLRLISKAENNQGLEEYLSRDYLDLAITYSLSVEMNSMQRGTMVLEKNICNQYGLTEMEIFSAAMKNSPVLQGTRMESIEEFLGYPVPETVMLYVLTNRNNYYGAASVLYSGKVEALSEEWESDVYIIPSSVHEVVLMKPMVDFDPSDMMEIIREVNRKELQKTDVLSDRLYVYSYAQKCISMV